MAYQIDKDIKPFGKKVFLSSPTMHGEELKWMKEAFDTNWMSTVGENINQVESICAEKLGRKYGVALSCGTAALHLAMKMVGIKAGTKVFCSDMTFSASVNPIVYEGGIPIFIDSERDTWNMDPIALEKAFKLHPEVKHVVVVNLYGTPAKLGEIRAIADAHNAVIVEDAAESLGAYYCGKQVGNFGDISIISFNGNKIITGSSGGMLLTDDKAIADEVRKLSTQARDKAPWYQHTVIGYNYRMSNVIAGVVRGQLPHIEEHIAQKKAIYMRYKEGLKDLPISMNPYDSWKSVPNYWLSCLVIDKKAMCKQTRGDNDYTYVKESGKTCPSEILEAILSINAEGRPIWKPMHMQPIYKNNEFISAEEGDGACADIFERGLCLPSDNKMTAEQQDRIIEVIRRCFD